MRSPNRDTMRKSPKRNLFQQLWSLWLQNFSLLYTETLLDGTSHFAELLHITLPKHKRFRRPFGFAVRTPPIIQRSCTQQAQFIIVVFLLTDE